MNKEEYKAEILEQFKTPYSAMRILMVESEFDKRLNQNYYRNRCSFFVETVPKLYFEVEEISNDLDGIFSVTFKDNIDIKQVNQTWFGFKHGNISSTKYYIETIYYMNERILFSLECCTINMNMDGIIEKKILLNRDVVIFNIKKLEFELDDNLDVIVANWYSFRRSYREVYLDFKPDFYNREQLNGFLETNQVDNETASDIRECFNNIAPNVKVPNMVQVVFNVREIVNSRIKEKRNTLQI